MAIFATGRGDPDGFPVVFHSESSGSYKVNYNNVAYSPGDGPPVQPNGTGLVRVCFPWYDGSSGYADFGSFGIFPYVTGDPISIGLDPADYQLWQFVELSPGPGDPAVRHEVLVGGGTVAPGSSASPSNDWEGTVDFTVNVDEFAFFDYLNPTEAVYYPDPMDPDALPFPITGGNAMPDGIPARKCYLDIEPREGQTVTVSVAIGGSTFTGSFTWASGTPFYQGLKHILDVVSQDGYASHATAYATVSGVALYDQASHSHTEGGGVWSISGGTASLTMTDPGTSGIDGSLIVDAEIPTVYRFSAKLVGADGADWPSAISVVYPGGTRAVAGSDTWDVTQKRWSVIDVLNGSIVDGDSVDEKELMTAHLSGLASHHLDKRDWRLQFKAWRCDGLTLSHVASHTVSGTWSGGASGGIGYVLS